VFWGNSTARPDSDRRSASSGTTSVVAGSSPVKKVWISSNVSSEVTTSVWV
jgi:hypothetical protein